MNKVKKVLLNPGKYVKSYIIFIYKKINRKIMFFIKSYWYKKAVRPIIKDNDTLLKRIKDIRELAQSNDDKVFYIIHKKWSKFQGLFANEPVFFTEILYAIAKGMIPVIDMQRYPCIYLPDEYIGKVNVWDYYYKQPFGYKLSDVKNGGGGIRQLIQNHHLGILNVIIDTPFLNT